MPFAWMVVGALADKMISWLWDRGLILIRRRWRAWRARRRVQSQSPVDKGYYDHRHESRQLMDRTVAYMKLARSVAVAEQTIIQQIPNSVRTSRPSQKRLRLRCLAFRLRLCNWVASYWTQKSYAFAARHRDGIQQLVAARGKVPLKDWFTSNDLHDARQGLAAIEDGKNRLRTIRNDIAPQIDANWVGSYTDALRQLDAIIETMMAAHDVVLESSQAAITAIEVTTHE